MITPCANSVYVANLLKCLPNENNSSFTSIKL